MTREIPPDAQALIKEFLAAQTQSNNSKPTAQERHLVEGLQSGRPLTPREAIALAKDHGAEILYGGKHCRIRMGNKEMGISLRPGQKTLDPGTCSDFKKFLGL